MWNSKGLRWPAVIPAALLSGALFAQGALYPSKPVTLIIPLAPGGPVEREMHFYTQKMQDQLGQPFILDYKLGAGGAIAAAYVAKAAPDGYTLLVVNSAFTIFPALYKDLSFDFIRDFVPISLVSKRPLLWMVPATFPAKTYAEYIAYAKAYPGKINLGTTGAGTGTHLSGAWLHNATNTRVTFVHYKGTGAVLPDLIAGRLDVSGVALPLALPLIKSGKLRALAMMGDKRTPFIPDLPTVAEQGIPGYEYGSYTGFVAPAATHVAIVNKLSEAFIRVVRLPDVTSRLEADGNVVIGNTPSQFRQLLVSETENWRKLVQDIGFKLEE